MNKIKILNQYDNYEIDKIIQINKIDSRDNRIDFIQKFNYENFIINLSFYHLIDMIYQNKIIDFQKNDDLKKIYDKYNMFGTQKNKLSDIIQFIINDEILINQHKKMIYLSLFMNYQIKYLRLIKILILI